MVVVDIDHPDIEDYINWKVKEEQKLAVGGYFKIILVFCIRVDNLSTLFCIVTMPKTRLKIIHVT